MIDPKKRLKEIIKKVYGQYPDNAGLAPTKNNHAEAIAEILKEFVHKETFIEEIHTILEDYSECEVTNDGMHYTSIDSIGFIEAIRKLIEGKK